MIFIIYLIKNPRPVNKYVGQLRQRSTKHNAKQLDVDFILRAYACLASLETLLIFDHQTDNVELLNH